jgi:predicted RNA-binding protein (TIGR00451 family)
MFNRSSNVLQKIRRVADYQFGKGAGDRLFPNRVTVVFSKKTGKIRHIHLDGNLLATLKPKEGLFSLTIEGAKRLIEEVEPKRLWVKLEEESSAFVERGSDVFAKHVISVDKEIRPREEVIILNKKNEVVAVGRAMLSGEEMRDFKRGVAVKVRRGNLEKIKKGEGDDSR